MLMNPSTLGHIYDTEWQATESQDCLTLAEVLDTVYDACWDELDKAPNGNYTARKPLISSLRRNLQRNHLDRLTSLSLAGRGSPATRTIATLALLQLGELRERIRKSLEGGLDPYSRAHLTDASRRIEKTLEAQYVVNP